MDKVRNSVIKKVKDEEKQLVYGVKVIFCYKR